MNRDKQIDEQIEKAMNINKQIEEMAKDLENHTCMSEFQAEIASRMLYAKGYRKSTEVAREFRQRMNEKMGKHTHLLGKEYVQRIMREIEKEFSEVENG